MIPVTLSGTVWYDRNSNQVIDPGEQGLSGITITIEVALQTPPGIPFFPVGTTTTDANGNWTFTYDFTENTGVWLIHAFAGDPPEGSVPPGWVGTTAQETNEFPINTGNPVITNFGGNLFGRRLAIQKQCFKPASMWCYEI